MNSSTCFAPQPSGSDGAVDRRGAAADDRHAAIEIEGGRAGEQIDHFDRQVFIRYAQLNWLPQTDSDADCIVTLL